MLRSMLFLPGNTPKMLEKGPYLSTDAVILDLEDAVTPEEKDAARILVRNALGALDFRGRKVVIRINGIHETDDWKEDLRELIPLKPDMIMLPKANSAADIHMLSAQMAEIEAVSGMEAGTTGIIALIETCLGLEHAFSIAGADGRVSALFLGAEDLTADMRSVRTKEGQEILYARTRLVTAARAAGIEVYDTPYTDVNDGEGLLADAAQARALGFTGKAAISPHHVDAINRIFSPTELEISYAHEVLNAFEQGRAQGKGAIALRGKMIDPPVVARAQQVIEMEAEMEGKFCRG